MSEKTIDHKEENPSAMVSRDDDVMVKIKLWKRISFGLAIVSIIGWYLWISNSDDTKLPEPVIKTVLADFILDIRSVSLDPITMRSNLQRAYSLITPEYFIEFDRIIKDRDFPGMADQGMTIMVTILEAQPRAGGTIYILSWNEKTFKDNKSVSEERFSGYFRLKYFRQDSQQDGFCQNPYGLYIDKLTIKKIEP